VSPSDRATVSEDKGDRLQVKLLNGSWRNRIGWIESNEVRLRPTLKDALRDVVDGLTLVERRIIFGELHRVGMQSGFDSDHQAPVSNLPGSLARHEAVSTRWRRKVENPSLRSTGYLALTRQTLIGSTKRVSKIAGHCQTWSIHTEINRESSLANSAPSPAGRALGSPKQAVSLSSMGGLSRLRRGSGLLHLDSVASPTDLLRRRGEGNGNTPECGRRSSEMLPQLPDTATAPIGMASDVPHIDVQSSIMSMSATARPDSQTS
jgi:hypothetical protein